jgi:hypothetical protein
MDKWSDVGVNNFNTAIGIQSLENLAYGDGNTAVGPYTMLNATGGFSNVAIGDNALRGSVSNSYGSYNVGIGVNAGLNLFAGSSNNTLIGSSAGSTITTGQNNTTIGYQAGSTITTGSNNIILGATGGTAGMTGTFAYYNNANNYLTINSGAVVTAINTSTDYIPIVIGGTTYKLLLST